MDTQIRELNVEDFHAGFLESLAALTEVRLSPEEAVRVHRLRMQQGVKTYVALRAGRVVGTASLLIEQKFIHGGGLVGHVEDVAVHRDCQRQGLGTALVQHATEAARQAGCYKVILDCFEHLAPFYARLGYRPFNLGLRADLPH